MKPETLVNHQPQVVLPEGNTPLTAPIYQGAKYTVDKFESLDDLFNGKTPGFFYSRISNPTVRQLELLLAQLQGRNDAVATGSGVAALAVTLMSALQHGDHVVMFYESYRPMRYLVGTFLKKFGVTSTMMSIHDREGLKKELSSRPVKLIAFESPTNPMVQIADIEHITSLAKKYGVLTLLDNTFAGFHNHGQYPIDIYVHSLTKFAGGHGDVTGGVIIADKDVLDKFRPVVMEIGAALDPNSAYLTLRGMKTYFLRYERQCANALKIATWLQTQKKTVTKVYYPGLSDDCGHELARKQMKDFGAVVSFDLASKAEGVAPFIDRLKLVKLAASLGSTETLVAPSEMFYGSLLTTEQKVIAKINPGAIRLAIGIEAVDDLIGDLAQALS